MSKFDEILDDVIVKARIAADVAGKKTGEVVEFSKLKYQAKQASWDIEKTYAKLGALVYEARKSDEDFDEAVKMAIEELDDLNARLDELEDKLADLKKSSKAAPKRPAGPKPTDEYTDVEYEEDPEDEE